MRLRLVTLTLALAASSAVHAMTDAELAAVIDRRLLGDRTGACFAVAVIDHDQVARAYRCADPDDAGRIEPRTAFEIGSVAKTMTAALLADLVESGQASLDDPLADWLPEGATVPEFEGQPILLRHVVSHTGGLPALPPGAPMSDMSDPYKAIGPRELLDALGRTTLARAPGTRFEYSNFASMLLSYALARRAGEDFETLLERKLLAPLGMDGAYINERPEGIVEAVGHLPNTRPTPAWRFQTDVAGVGGVRATLDDMIRYVRGHLGAAPAPLDAALAMTRAPVDTPSAHPVAMNWMLAPLDERSVHVHEGGTGGFSSFVAFDRERGRGVVVLSDTAMTTLGGLGDLGQHLLDARLPLGEPRKAMPAPEELVDALVGDWRLEGGMTLTLRRRGAALALQPQGQPEFELGHDSAGDFYPLTFDALLAPRRTSDGDWRFDWHQSGAGFPARRIDSEAASIAPSLPPERLREYAGSYPLAGSGLVLAVRAQDGALFAQATGQGAFALEPAGTDVFEAAAFDIEIRFQRGDNGNVIGLSLLQAGQTLRGERR